MFIWGSGHKTLVILIVDSHPCPECNQVAKKFLQIGYDYDHIFWLFKGIKNRVVTARCEQCMSVTKLDNNATKVLFSDIGSNPIPFMDRFGAHVLIAIVAGWFVVARYLTNL